MEEEEEGEEEEEEDNIWRRRVTRPRTADCTARSFLPSFNLIWKSTFAQRHFNYYVTYKLPWKYTAQLENRDEYHPATGISTE